MGEKEGGGKKKRRKSNYSAGIIINSQLVPRNYSFEGHGRQKGKGDERKREKEEENGSFVEKLTTPFPHIAVAIVLTERTGNTTNGGPRLSSRARVALFTIFTGHFFFHFFLPPFASRSLSPFLRSARKLPKNMSVRTKTRYGVRGKALPNSETRQRRKRGEKPVSGGLSKIRERERTKKRVEKGREIPT